MGHGEGRGDVTPEGVLAGSMVAICFLVFMFCCGLPILAGGIAMLCMQDLTSQSVTVGVVLIVVSIIFIIAGIVLTVLVCCAGTKRTPQRGQVITQPGGATTVVQVQPYQTQQGYPMAQQPYPGQQGYPGQYPPMQQQTYTQQPQPYKSEYEQPPPSYNQEYPMHSNQPLPPKY